MCRLGMDNYYSIHYKIYMSKFLMSPEYQSQNKPSAPHPTIPLRLNNWGPIEWLYPGVINIVKMALAMMVIL